MSFRLAGSSSGPDSRPFPFSGLGQSLVPGEGGGRAGRAAPLPRAGEPEAARGAQVREDPRAPRAAAPPDDVRARVHVAAGWRQRCREGGERGWFRRPGSRQERVRAMGRSPVAAPGGLARLGRPAALRPRLGPAPPRFSWDPGPELQGLSRHLGSRLAAASDAPRPCAQGQ